MWLSNVLLYPYVVAVVVCPFFIVVIKSWLEWKIVKLQFVFKTKTIYSCETQLCGLDWENLSPYLIQCYIYIQISLKIHKREHK